MAFLTKEISEDPRVQISEGILYFDGSADQLITLIIQDAVDTAETKRLEQWKETHG
jgi:hypothetical protein